MKGIPLFIATTIMLAGCVTAPATVKEEYLKNASKEQMDKLYAIDDQIIAVNNERDRLEKQLKITKQEAKVVETSIATFKSVKKQLKEKQKLYAEMNDNQKIASGLEEIAKNDRDLANENLRLEYQEAKISYEKSLIEVKHAELAAKLAERELERARIARLFQEAALAEKPVEQKENLIDVKKYEDYLAKQQEILARRLDTKNEASETLAQAELRLGDIRK